MSNPPPTDPPGPDPTAEPYGSSWPVGRSAVPPPGYRRHEYETQGYPHPPEYGYPGSDPGLPRRTNVPLITVILAIAVLLVGATATATVLAGRSAADRARAAAKPITHPTTRPAVRTTAPRTPAAPVLPSLPDIPGLPTLPSGWPNLPGQGTTVTVTYEVTGDGPAEILYAEKLGKNPVRIRNVKLPWKITTKMDGTALVLVTAVRVGPEPGTISCRATVDGKQVAKSTHDGSFVSVTCSKLIIP